VSSEVSNQVAASGSYTPQFIAEGRLRLCEQAMAIALAQPLRSTFASKNLSIDVSICSLPLGVNEIMRPHQP
jgi:hypothetical protein